MIALVLLDGVVVYELILLVEVEWKLLLRGVFAGEWDQCWAVEQESY